MRKRLRTIVLLLSAACGVNACTGFESGKTVTSPTSSTASVPGGTANGALIGTWGTQSDAFTLPSPASCANFQWQITSQSATAVAGTFAATCDGGVAITANASGTLTTPTTVAVTITGVALISGVPVCNFTLGGTGTIVDNDTLTIPYSGTTCVGPVHGTQTLRRHRDAPAPAPEPIPTYPADPGPSGPAGLDAIDLGRATLLNSPHDFASWPITTTIAAVDIQSSGIHVDFSKRDGPGRWPDIVPPGWDGPLQYTLGMALTINGQWYASTVVQYWYGLDRSGGAPSQYATNWFYDPNRWAPMTYHQPQPGELIGLFVCEGDCRNNWEGSNSPLRERSNVVLVPMPSDAGSYHTFSFR